MSVNGLIKPLGQWRGSEKWCYTAWDSHGWGRVTKYYTQVRIILILGTCNISCKLSVRDASLVIVIKAALLLSFSCILVGTLGFWCNCNWVRRLGSQSSRGMWSHRVVRKVVGCLEGQKLLSSYLCRWFCQFAECLSNVDSRMDSRCVAC